MLVSGLVVPFFVVRRSRAVSLRGKIMVFSSLLVRIVHGSTSVAASTPPVTGEEKNTRLNHISTTSTALSKCEQIKKNVSVIFRASPRSPDSSNSRANRDDTRY